MAAGGLPTPGERMDMLARKLMDLARMADRAQTAGPIEGLQIARELAHYNVVFLGELLDEVKRLRAEHESVRLRVSAL